MMQKATFQLKFLTPTFIGGAGSAAQLRTPPIKALLRHYWRMAWYAASQQQNATDIVEAMRKEEGKLFGNASDHGGQESQKAKLRIRLDDWSDGSLAEWPSEWQGGSIHHPEVGHHGMAVSSALYLGYGPLEAGQGKGTAKLGTRTRRAIKPETSATLKLAFPEEHKENLFTALALMHHFGTLGGRSRNGWGSFELFAKDDTASEALNTSITSCQRDWREALGESWPHALGKDANGALVWVTEAQKNPGELIQLLASVRLAVRLQFPFAQGNTTTPELRHWLAYPAGSNHKVTNWGKQKALTARLPNNLRFKVQQHKEGGLQGCIFHIPCSPHQGFQPNHKEIERTWGQVHLLLDALCTQSQEGPSLPFVNDAERRQALEKTVAQTLLSRAETLREPS